MSACMANDARGLVFMILLFVNQVVIVHIREYRPN